MYIWSQFLTVYLYVFMCSKHEPFLYFILDFFICSKVLQFCLTSHHICFVLLKTCKNSICPKSTNVMSFITLCLKHMFINCNDLPYLICKFVHSNPFYRVHYIEFRMLVYNLLFITYFSIIDHG